MSSDINQSAERYRLLAEQSTDMISRHTPTPEWTYIDVTSAVETLLGYSVEEIRGTPGYDLFHPDDADNLKKRADSVSYREGLYTNTYRYRHKKGHYVWIETTSRTIRDKDGEPIEIICVSRDVTERKLAQQATRRLARVVEASSDMIMFCNHSNHQITYRNEACEKTLALGSAKIELHLPQLFAPRVFDEQVRPALSIAALEGSWHGSLSLRLTENTERIAEIREIIAHRNNTDHNGVEYYTLIGRDITVKVKAEEAAKRQQLELAHMSRLMSVGEMATGLAHELNQPLAAILNYCRGAQRRLDEQPIPGIEPINKAMSLISKQAIRAAEIIKRMRSFTKRTEYQRMEFPINESCVEVSDFLKQEAHDMQIRFVYELDPIDPVLLADKIQVEQVLLNLIRNAIEAYSDCDNPDRPVIIATDKQDSYLQISVIDNAMGIGEDTLNQLFEPFFSSKANGLGMGLAISRTIIETHGGQLWAESDGKSGTSFHVRMPLKG